MSHITRELLLDCSTPEIFSFSLECAECGKVWHSTPIPFSRAGVMPATEGKRIIFDTLYSGEKETAVQKAIEEAAKVFSRCPICKRLVCDYCFMVCEDLDMCLSCAKRLQEDGEPVMQYA